MKWSNFLFGVLSCLWIIIGVVMYIFNDHEELVSSWIITTFFFFTLFLVANLKEIEDKEEKNGR